MEKLLKEILEKLNVTMSYLYVEVEGNKIKSLMDIYQEIKQNQPGEVKDFDIDVTGIYYNEELINKLAVHAQKTKKFLVSVDRNYVYIEFENKVYRVEYTRFIDGKIR
jgi:predicted RNA-binding protein